MHGNNCAHDAGNCSTNSAPVTRKRKVFTPSADILESKDSVTILADMPGVDEKHLDITLEKNVLSIKGSILNHAPDGLLKAYGEYDESDYERAFKLGDEVDRERITATVNNGVLKLVLAKAGPAQARKIEVKA